MPAAGVLGAPAQPGGPGQQSVVDGHDRAGTLGRLAGELQQACGQRPLAQVIRPTAVILQHGQHVERFARRTDAASSAEASLLIPLEQAAIDENPFTPAGEQILRTSNRPRRAQERQFHHCPQVSSTTFSRY
ncbi:hypothetical protein [Janthinobacterium sp. HLS12-2]|uniref:hypothetical protein n=1 Tax=Janthinobacterium sp. HLS12-2 TaxID=1259324 RepID=UPI003F21B2F4